jgi:pyruvate dehydrogenase E1 component alpha subunit
MDKYNLLCSGKIVSELNEDEIIEFKKELIEFEREIASAFEECQIPYPIHFSGGNEDQLINIFKNIRRGDYIFSTHRSHYHYLLAGGSPIKLKKMIFEGKSICICDKELNFFSSGIVAGTPAIAAGVALGLKISKKEGKVWCFVGDGAEDEGHFYEAVRYVSGNSLPCQFIIEDNNRSVETPKLFRFGKCEINWPECVFRYHYSPIYPHVGTGKWVNFEGIKSEKWM